MKIFISLITTQIISTIIAFLEFEEPKEIVALTLQLTAVLILLLLKKFNLSELLQRVILLGQAILIFVLMPNSQYKYFTGAYHIIIRLISYQQVSRLLMLEWTGIFILEIQKIALLLVVFIFGTSIDTYQVFRSVFSFIGLICMQSFHLYVQLRKVQRKQEIMICSQTQNTVQDSNLKNVNQRIIDPYFSELQLDDQFNIIGFKKQSSILNNLENSAQSILKDIIINKIDSQSKSVLQWRSSGCCLQNLLDQIRANRIPMIIQILDYSHPQLNNHFIKIIYQNDFLIQFLEMEERDRFQKQKYIYIILKQLLSTMSHEFGTSLNYLLAIAQVAIEKYADSDLLKYFMPIKSIGLIMHNFVLDMVDYNNIKGKKLELQLERIDEIYRLYFKYNLNNSINYFILKFQIQKQSYVKYQYIFNVRIQLQNELIYILRIISQINQLLEEIINIFNHTLQQKGLKLTYEILLVEKTILTDGRRLKQILITLIQNAQKFTFSGGIKLIVKSIEQNKFVQFEIQDTGIGMTKSEIDRVTEMLKYDYKQEKQISKNTAGFGLGSFLCNKIAMSLSNLKYQQGGGIRYFSGQDIKGTKVVFKIINEPFKLSYTITATQDNFSGILKVGKNAVIDTKQSQIEIGLSALKNSLTKKCSSVIVQNVNNFNNDPIKELFLNRFTTKDMQELFVEVQREKTKKEQDSINEETNEEDYQKRLQFQSIRISNNQKQRKFRKESCFSEEIDNIFVSCNCKQILIVDDEMINILGLQLMLKSFNLESDFSYNGQEALSKLENAHCQYSLIFMDINMPIMDGFATTKAIIERYKKHSPIIIACTAFTDSETKQYCYKIGMSHFINKPVNKNELQKLLCYLMN